MSEEQIFKIATEYDDKSKGVLGCYYGEKINYSPKAFIVYIMLAVILPFIFALVLLIYALVRSLMPMSVVCCILFLGLAILPLLITKRLNRYAQSNVASAKPVVYATVDSGGVGLNTYYGGKEIAKGQIAFERIIRAADYDNYIFLFIDEYVAVMLDKKGFIIGQPEELTEYLKDRGINSEKFD